MGLTVRGQAYALRRALRRSLRLAVVLLTALSLVSAHIATAEAAPGEPRARTVPCHVQDAGDALSAVTGMPVPAVAQDQQDGKASCPLMRGALCAGLFAVSPPSFSVAARVESGAPEPWFYGPASQPYLLSPPQRPPKPL